MRKVKCGEKVHRGTSVELHTLRSVSFYQRGGGGNCHNSALGCCLKKWGGMTKAARLFNFAKFYENIASGKVFLFMLSHFYS